MDSNNLKSKVGRLAKAMEVEYMGIRHEIKLYLYDLGAKESNLNPNPVKMGLR